MAASTNNPSAEVTSVLPTNTHVDLTSHRNPTMGDLHKILVPAGYLVDSYADNMAWKRGEDIIYFEVDGTGNGQIDREIVLLARISNGEELWTTQKVKVESGQIYFSDMSDNWSPVVIAEIGSETQIEDDDDPEPFVTNRRGMVNHSLVRTLQDSWRREGWRNKPRSEQVQALALMIAVIRNDIDDPADEEATLDYVQRTIGSW